MSVSSQITRISTNVSNALTAIASKGVTVPASAKSDQLASLIALIPKSLEEEKKIDDMGGNDLPF